jgi:uncharacterized membrane protein
MAPPEKRPAKPAQATIQVQGHVAQSFEGPLPHPAVMEGYEKLHPGAAALFFRLFEEQSKRRMEEELVYVHAETKAMLRGQVFGFVLAFGGLVAGFTLALLDRPTEAIAAIVVGIAPVASSLISSIRARKEK